MPRLRCRSPCLLGGKVSNVPLRQPALRGVRLTLQKVHRLVSEQLLQLASVQGAQPPVALSTPRFTVSLDSQEVQTCRQHKVVRRW